MAKKEKKSSGMPAAIILCVLVLAGGFLFCRSSWTSQSNSNRAANTANPAARPTLNTAGAPPGATPPNAVGAPAAAVTLEEFADFQCPACAASYPVLKDVIQAYSGNQNFRFVFRNFPLSMHEKAYDAAVAAEAAGLQNPAKFWLMEEQLFTNQTTWSTDLNYRDAFSEFASKIGLDVVKFKADMAGMQAKTRVDQDITRGRALAISSTPSVIVNGKLVPYQEVTLAGLKRIIDAELAAFNSPQQQQSASLPNK